MELGRIAPHSDVCGSKMGQPQNGTVANGTKDDSTCGPYPGGLILTHTQMLVCVWFASLFSRRLCLVTAGSKLRDVALWPFAMSRALQNITAQRQAGMTSVIATPVSIEGHESPVATELLAACRNLAEVDVLDPNFIVARHLSNSSVNNCLMFGPFQMRGLELRLHTT